MSIFRCQIDKILLMKFNKKNFYFSQNQNGLGCVVRGSGIETWVESDLKWRDMKKAQLVGLPLPVNTPKLEN